MPGVPLKKPATYLLSKIASTSMRFFNFIVPYSRSATSETSCTPQMFGASWLIAEPSGGAPSKVDSRSLAPQAVTSTRRPRAESERASAAVTVVLPTPPLPVMNRKRRGAKAGIEEPAVLSRSRAAVKFQLLGLETGYVVPVVGHVCHVLLVLPRRFHALVFCSVGARFG